MPSTVFDRFQKLIAMPPALNRAIALENKILQLTAKNKINLNGIYLDVGCGLES